MTLDEIRRKRVILLTIGMVVVLILTIVTPSNISNLSSYPKPTKDYAEAAQRIERLRAQLPKAMNPICQTQFWSHDKKVGRVIVLIHGYTNCPEQFHELGKRFYSLGYNVLIAPLPHHGLADRMTKSHGLLKAEEMTAYADNVVDIAQGLRGSYHAGVFCWRDNYRLGSTKSKRYRSGGYDFTGIWLSKNSDAFDRNRNEYRQPLTGFI